MRRFAISSRMASWVVLSVAVAVAVALSSSGCTTLPPGTCNSHADCDSGQACIAGTCQALSVDCTRDEDCPALHRCEVSSGMCVPDSNGCTDPCRAGERRCWDNDIEMCRSDGCGYELVQTCACGCSGGECVATVCTPGAMRCNGDAVERCRSDGCLWETIQTCPVGCLDGACTTQVCTPGATQCRGNTVERCRSDGSVWESVETCSCGCNAGACVSQLCTPNETRCDGNNLERCRADACGWDLVQSCSCGCLSGSCVTQLCTPNENQCNGNDLERCRADGCGWDLVQTCSCGCSGANCVTQLCTPGSTRCSGDTVEQCRADGCGWNAVQTCACGCSGGSCLPTTCAPLATRCSGNVLEQCRSDGCAWIQGQHCSPGTCVPHGYCVPAEWACDPSWYGDGGGCDCDCGAWDPDCDDPGQQLYCRAGAPADSVCMNPGICVSAGWTCNPTWFDANDGCDCDCGAWDPDCDKASQELFCWGGGGPGYFCVRPGVCVPETAPASWTCSPAFYNEGDFCDCECGAWDPDCADPTLQTWECIGSEKCVYPGVCE